MPPPKGDARRTAVSASRPRPGPKAASTAWAQFIPPVKSSTARLFLPLDHLRHVPAAGTRRARGREPIAPGASGSPAEWRDAVAWLRWLPDLPSVEHLLRGHKVPPWMRADPVMRELAFDEPQRRREALAGLPLAPVQLDETATSPRVVDAWIEEWRRRLPASARAADSQLMQMLEWVLQHLEAMRSSEADDGKGLRNALSARLARRFRRGAGTATALFSHLVLDGLELERVRAGVMTRRLLPERAEGRSWA